MSLIILLLNTFSAFLCVHARMLHTVTHSCVRPALYYSCLVLFIQQPPVDLFLAFLKAELPLTGAAGAMETCGTRYTAYKVLSCASGELHELKWSLRVSCIRMFSHSSLNTSLFLPALLLCYLLAHLRLDQK